MSCCSISSSTPVKYFLTLSRLTFGFWLFWLGLEKTGILTADPNDGISAFVNGYIVPTFTEKTILPSFLLYPAGWFIALGELFLGILLLVGLQLRWVWTIVSLLLFTLLFGQTLVHEHITVSNIWFYLVFAIVNGALANYEDFYECCDDDDCCSTEDSCCGGDSKEGSTCCQINEKKE